MSPLHRTVALLSSRAPRQGNGDRSAANPPEPAAPGGRHLRLIRGLGLWLGLAVALTMAAGPWSSAQSTLAQDCLVEVEPNDAPEAAPGFVGPGCMTGMLTEEDPADHLTWTIGPEQAGQRWDLALGSEGGAPGILVVSRVVSDPAAATLALETAVVELRTEAAQQAARADLWLRPGRYLLTVGPGGLWTGTPTSYRVDIAPGAPLPTSADAEPNDDAPVATPIADAFEVSGDAAATVDVFAWSVGEDPGEPGLWTVEARGAMGAPLALTVSDAGGAIEGDTRSLPDGIARLPDLRLSPGIHTIRLVGPPEPATPYILRAYREDVPIADPEPNDDPARALPITPGDLMTGRLARLGDWDAYRLTVDEALGSALIDVRLIIQAGPPRRLCLSRLTPGDRGLGEEVRELTCSEGPAGASLGGLLLEPGDYQLVVAGAESLLDPYYLRVDRSVAPEAGFELEPNDTPALATLMTPATPMRGRLGEPRPRPRPRRGGAAALAGGGSRPGGPAALGAYRRLRPGLRRRSRRHGRAERHHRRLPHPGGALVPPGWQWRLHGDAPVPRSARPGWRARAQRRPPPREHAADGRIRHGPPGLGRRPR